MTKRISAVILALVLAMTLLAGCGSNKTQKETTNSVATGKDDKETERIMKIIKTIMKLHLRQKMQGNIILPC